MKLNAIRQSRCVAVNAIRQSPCVAVNAIRQSPCLAVNAIRQSPCLAVNAIRQSPCLAVNAIRQSPCLAVHAIRQSPCLAVNAIPQSPSLAVNAIRQSPSLAVNAARQSPCVAVNIGASNFLFNYIMWTHPIGLLSFSVGVCLPSVFILQRTLSCQTQLSHDRQCVHSFYFLYVGISGVRLVGMWSVCAVGTMKCLNKTNSATAQSLVFPVCTCVYVSVSVLRYAWNAWDIRPSVPMLVINHVGTLRHLTVTAGDTIDTCVSLLAKVNPATNQRVLLLYSVPMRASEESASIQYLGNNGPTCIYGRCVLPTMYVYRLIVLWTSPGPAACKLMPLQALTPFHREFINYSSTFSLDIITCHSWWQATHQAHLYHC